MGICSIRQEFDDYFVALQIHKLLRRELVSELGLQYFRIGVSDSESDQCADIAEDGLPDRQRKLIDVLVRENQA